MIGRMSDDRAGMDPSVSPVLDRALVFATSTSPHAVGQDVVDAVGPNALLCFQRGYADTGAEGPAQVPAYISREVS
jgi:hypothetical protein